MIKTLKISEEVHKRLCLVGHKKESFDTIIKRLCETYEQQQNNMNGVDLNEQRNNIEIQG